MIDPTESDFSLAAARLALDGLAKRQEMIGHNLANVDTPGYQAKDVAFENALQRALHPVNQLGLQATHQGHLPNSQAGSPAYQVSLRQGGSQRADGNNVDIDVELTQMAETGLRYQSLTQLVNKKFNLLKGIAASR